MQGSDQREVTSLGGQELLLLVVSWKRTRVNYDISLIHLTLSLLTLDILGRLLGEPTVGGRVGAFRHGDGCFSCYVCDSDVLQVD